MTDTVMIECVTPIVCIFCKFTTCIEFDMELHLYGNHRVQVFRTYVGRGSLDSRLQYAINDGREAGKRLDVNWFTYKQPQTQIPERQVVKYQNKSSFKPIFSVERFFGEEQSLPLHDHSFEQSPCFLIIGYRPFGKHMLFHCELHPRIRNIHLASIEHHCKYNDPTTKDGIEIPGNVCYHHIP